MNKTLTAIALALAASLSLAHGDAKPQHGGIVQIGNSSRRMEFQALKVIASAGLPGQPSAADVLPEPVLVCRASGTCVVPKPLQRRGG